MGLWSKIKKGFKKIVKGIGKVFKKILKPIGKILGSSWGKALMIGLSIFTFGGALLAGAQSFASTTGSFLTKFVAGGKDFVGALIGKKAGTDAVAGAGEALAPVGTQASIDAVLPGLEAATTAGNVAAPAAAGGGALSQAAGAAAPVAGAIPGVGPTVELAAKGGQLAAEAAPSMGAKAGGWLRDAASAGLEFVKSPSGSTLVGNMMQGYDQGRQNDEFIKNQQRYDRMWTNPNDPGVQQIQNFQGSETPANWPGADQSGVVNTRNRGYEPTIPFRRYQPTGG